MKTTMVALACIVCSINCLAQHEWTTPIQITTGSNNDLHPSIADAPGWLHNLEECIAFSRNGKDIWITSTEQFGQQWTSPFALTHDSTDNDYPSLTYVRLAGYAFPTDLMAVWQSRRSGNLDIWWSRRTQQGWSDPAALTSSPADDVTPSIAQRDSGCGVVWEQRGRIMFSEFTQSGWSAPEQVTPQGDSSNSRPNSTFFFTYPVRQPIVVWQRKKADTTFAVMYSIKTGLGWSLPDTIAFSDDNRCSRFFKARPSYYMTTVGWSRKPRNGPWGICSRNATWINNAISWETSESLSSLGVDSYNQSVNGYMIITDRLTPWFSIAASEFHPLLHPDSIAVTRPWQFEPTRLGVPTSLGNRNPDVGAGVVLSNGLVRLWVVWESLTSGYWRLWGSNVLISIGDISGLNELPREPSLKQNYPNPFNPETRIEFQIAISSLVTLKVYDILGCEVATIVNEWLMPGSYARMFNASTLPGGVYFYRLSSGQFVQTKKSILLR